MNSKIIANNLSIQLARQYAKDTNQHKLFLSATRRISEFPTNRISINARKTKKPVPCLHITIKNKDKGKIISGTDFTLPVQENIGELVFRVIREFSDKQGELYKKVFGK
ncbi:MAG: hypothetical protein ACLSWI_04790 [Candidatus Gastranaerophilaceae bacterium]